MVQLDTITDAVKGPVYVYYQLDNFYQNHRRYVMSRSYAQLMGTPITETQAKLQCDPIITNANMGVTTSVDGTALEPNDIAYPCGLIAKSVFTDSYVLSTTSDMNTLVDIDSSDIAWKSDVEYKFKN